MAHEAFDAAKAFRQGKNLKSFEHGDGLLLVSFEEHRHHPSAILHLPPGQFVSGMVGEERIYDPFDLGMRLKPGRDCKRVGGMTLEAQWQRFDATQAKKTGE